MSGLELLLFYGVSKDWLVWFEGPRASHRGEGKALVWVSPLSHLLTPQSTVFFGLPSLQISVSFLLVLQAFSTAQSWILRVLTDYSLSLCR